MSACYLSGDSEATGFWSEPYNPRWVRTLSHLGAAVCITASTSVLARSFTARGSRTLCAGDQWKKFLSYLALVSSAEIASA